MISTLKGVSVIQLTGDGSVVPIPVNLAQSLVAKETVDDDDEHSI